MKKLFLVLTISLLTTLLSACNGSYAVHEKQQQNQKEREETIKKLFSVSHQKILNFLEQNPNPLPPGKTKDEGFEMYSQFILLYYSSIQYNEITKDQFVEVVKKAEVTLDIKKN